jgi:hypothetical protein
MTNLETELTHLVALMADPYRENWKAYCWAKAQILAQHNPADYAGLPAALANRMKSDSPANGRQVSSTNEVKEDK